MANITAGPGDSATSVQAREIQQEGVECHAAAAYCRTRRVVAPVSSAFLPTDCIGTARFTRRDRDVTVLRADQALTGHRHRIVARRHRRDDRRVRPVTRSRSSPRRRSRSTCWPRRRSGSSTAPLRSSAARLYLSGSAVPKTSVSMTLSPPPCPPLPVHELEVLRRAAQRDDARAIAIAVRRPGS